MDEDDDVLYEGSELFKHLQENGFSEFESFKYEQVTPEVDPKEFQKCESLGFSNKYAEFIWKNILKIIGAENINEDLIAVTYLKLLPNITLTEHLCALENISPFYQNLDLEADLDSVKQQIDKKYILSNLNSWKSLKILFVVFMTLFACEIFINGRISSHALLLCFIFFIIVGLRIIIFLKFYTSQSILDEFLSLSSHILKQSSKSQKIINEIEFISKSVSVGFLRSSYNALVESQEKMLYEFSYCLLASHRKLLTMSDNSELKIIFDEYFDKPEAIIENVSSSILKVNKEKMGIQLSALLTEIVLSLEFSSQFSRKFHIYVLCLSLHKVILEKRIKMLEKLTSHIKNMWFEPFEVKVKKCSHNEDNVLASLSLHAKSFLSMVYQLSDVNKEEDPEQFYSYCEDATAQLSSCSGCLDSLKLPIEKPKEPVTKLELPVQIEKETIDLNKEPVIVDEVFEAYISNDTDPTESSSVCVDEGEQIKMQKNSTESVLKEMQPILKQRRVMWEKREDAAIKRMQNQEQFSSAINQTVVEKNEFKCDPEITYESGEDVQSRPDEYDSDEERLALYKKVKAELDKDEKERGGEMYIRKRHRKISDSSVPIAITTNSEDSQKEQIYQCTGSGESEVNIPKTLEERISSWNGPVGLSLKSVLDPNAVHRFLIEGETFGGTGEAESDDYDT